MRARRARAIAATAAVAAVVWPGSASAARGLDLGLTDATVFQSADAGTRDAWLDRASAARSDWILLSASWRSIAPDAPTASFNPVNPADPGYDWGTLDAAARSVAARGLGAGIIVSGAPDWAEGPGRKASAPPGTWKPDPEAVRQFAIAVARRYSGDFVDPANSGAGPLPRITRFQLWAEPNLSIYLTPQWENRKPVGATHYRAMLNAFYAGIKSVSPGSLVLTGGTGPYGDPGRKGVRMQPVIFWRNLVKQSVSFDVAAVNPINVGAPTRHAVNKEDISTPDIGKLRRILARAQNHISPQGRRPIWATEIWWDSRPPDPAGIGLRQHARWLAQAFYVLWKQGVGSVVWFQIRDQAAGGEFESTFQTGLFFVDGRSKPAYRAFGFPFVADRLGGSKVRVWGKAPSGGSVEVQRKQGGGWKTIKRLRAGTNRVFTGKVRIRGTARLRAQASGETSLPWKLGAG